MDNGGAGDRILALLRLEDVDQRHAALAIPCMFREASSTEVITSTVALLMPTTSKRGSLMGLALGFEENACPEIWAAGSGQSGEDGS